MSKTDELKAKNENLFERNTVLLNENERLKKENAELKAKLNFSTQYYLGEKAKDQLAQAKEIIQQFLIQNPISDWLVKKAEQFLRKTDIDNAIQKADEEKDAWQKYYNFGR